MNKKVNQMNRKFKIITLMMIGVLLFSAVAMAIVGIVGYNSKDKDQPIVGYNLRDGSLTTFNPNYIGNTTFEISNAKGLINFASSVNDGVNFFGKTVILTSDIDYESENDYSIGFGGIGVQGKSNNGVYYDATSFRGVFEGCGHTISNFEISSQSIAYIEPDATGALIGANFLGFFGCLGSGAVIKDLGLKDFGLYDKTYNSEPPSIDSGKFWETYIGGIAGGYNAGHADGGVIISNCAVENMTIEKSNGNASRVGYAVGGIIGGYAGTSYAADYAVKLSINNCYVKDVNLSTSFIDKYINPARVDNDKRDGEDYIGAVIGYIAFVSGYTYNINNCVFAGTNPSYFAASAYGSSTHYITPSSTVYLVKTDYSGLSDYMDSASGAEGSIWYFIGSDYNSGYPCLRSFITWSKYIVKSNNTDLGNVSPSG